MFELGPGVGQQPGSGVACENIDPHGGVDHVRVGASAWGDVGFSSTLDPPVGIGFDSQARRWLV